MLQPRSDIDAERWAHTRLRRNILDGVWELEVQTRMKEQYGLNNIRNMGRPSMAINLFANTVDQVSIIYDAAGTISNTAMDDAQAQCWDACVTGCHFWSLEQDMSKKVIGLRECFYALVPTPSGMQLEIVTPDEIVVDKTSGDASRPTALRRARTFNIEDEVTGKCRIVDAWECWDVSDPEAPRHWVEDGDGKEMTLDVYPLAEGQTEHTYLFQDAEGPFLPWAFYRAHYTSSTFDPYAGSEIVHGTLDIAIHWTMWGVCLRNNSWPQWWLMDADVPGTAMADTAGNDGTSPPESIELAPNSILRFKSEGQPGIGKVGQLEPADAKTMAESILTKQNTILNNVGIHPDDVSTSGGIQSGVAIQLKRSVQRKVAMSYVPMFKEADENLFSLLARCHNIFYADAETGVPALPTTNWTIEYSMPEASTDEFMADLEKDKQLIALGLKSKVDLAMKLYNLSEPDALKKLQAVSQYNTMFPIPL